MAGRIGFDWTAETSLDRIIAEALGAASVCWEYPERAGTFDSGRATEILLDVIDIIHEKQLL